MPQSRLFIFVPKRGSFVDRQISRGSAVVGFLTPQQEISIYFEGDIYSHDPGETYNHRIKRLAARIFGNAQTSTVMRLTRAMRSQVITVGRVNSAMKIQYNNDEAERLADMYGSQIEDQEEAAA